MDAVVVEVVEVVELAAVVVVEAGTLEGGGVCSATGAVVAVVAGVFVL